MTKQEYEKLDKSEEYERQYGMLNCYVCPKHHYTFVIDRDHGVTPFMIRCEHRERIAGASIMLKGSSLQCRATAESRCYRVPEEYSSKATHEFYRPSFEYFEKHVLDPRMREHVEGGGLCFRKIGDLHCYGAEVTNG